jgi:hypothetical protein
MGEPAVYSPRLAVRGGQEERDFLHSRRRASCKGIVAARWRSPGTHCYSQYGVQRHSRVPSDGDQRYQKARGVFDRYKIVSKSDLHEAAKKLAQQDQERDALQPSQTNQSHSSEVV